MPSATPEPIVARLRDAMREVMTSKGVVGVVREGWQPCRLSGMRLSSPSSSRRHSARLMTAVQKIGKVVEQ